MCDQCEILSINGVLCHEHGCPNAYRDEKRKCFDCGFDFSPEERFQRVCNDCQNYELEQFETIEE